MTDDAAHGRQGCAADVSRRGFLRAASLSALGLGGAVLVSTVAGCAVGDDASGPGSGGRSGTATGQTPPAEPDVRLAITAAASEAELAAFCAAALKTTPGLRGVLQPLRVRQREHLVALHRAVVGAATPTVRPSTPSASSTATIPRHTSQVAAELERRLSVAERQRLDECLAATFGPLGRLLASISASHAQSLLVLRRPS